MTTQVTFLKFTQVVYGWNTIDLAAAIEQTIRSGPSWISFTPDSTMPSSGFSLSLVVSFQPRVTKISIESDNRILRTTNNDLFKFLSVVLCFWPFACFANYIVEKFCPHWSVCGATYQLKPGPANSTNLSGLGSLSRFPTTS